MFGVIFTSYCASQKRSVAPAHAAVGNGQLLQAAVLVEHVLGRLGILAALLRIVLQQGEHAQLEGRARNHAVLKGGRAFRTDVVAAPLQIIDRPAGRGEMPLVSLPPLRIGRGQRSLDFGQFQHVLSHVSDRGVVPALARVRTVSRRRPVGNSQSASRPVASPTPSPRYRASPGIRRPADRPWQPCSGPGRGGGWAQPSSRCTSAAGFHGNWLRPERQAPDRENSDVPNTPKSSPATFPCASRPFAASAPPPSAPGSSTTTTVGDT